MNSKQIIAIAIAPLSLFILVCLTGCGSPGIVKISPDTYMLTKDDHGGIFSLKKHQLKTDAIREANDFAEKQGKLAIPVSLKEHPMGILGDWASVEYQFRVVDKNDNEAKRTSLVPRADITIEKNEHITSNIHTKDETPKAPDVYAELLRLDDLRKRGIINDAEFDAQKQKLLSGAK